jgi:Prephenate dehydratase
MLSLGASREFRQRPSRATSKCAMLTSPPTFLASLPSVAHPFFFKKALGQCRHYLASKYPGVQLRPVASTALGAQLAADDPSVLGIASAVCENVFGLEIVDRSVQDAGERRRLFSCRIPYASMLTRMLNLPRRVPRERDHVCNTQSAARTWCRQDSVDILGNASVSPILGPAVAAEWFECPKSRGFTDVP